MRNRIPLLLLLVPLGIILWAGYPRQLPKDDFKQVTFSIVRYNPCGTIDAEYEHRMSAGYWRYHVGKNLHARWFVTAFDISDKDGRWTGIMKR